MARYFNSEGVEYNIKNKNFDNGAEGQVFLVDYNRVIKIFSNKNRLSKIKKVTEMIKMRNRLNESDRRTINQIAAWPLKLVYDQSKKPVGYEMDFVQGMSLNSFMSKPILQRYETYSYYNNAVVAYNLSLAVSKIHKIFPNVCIGDMSKMNIMVLPKHLVKFIDTDSFEIDIKSSSTTFIFDDIYMPCEVYTPGYVSPERVKDKKVKLTQHSDDFVLSIILFELLMTNQHPFACYSKYGQNLTRDEAISKGMTPYFKKNKFYQPKGTLRPNQVLTSNLCHDFYTTFTSGINHIIQRVKAEKYSKDLYKFISRLEKCQNNSEHYHLKGAMCPFCNPHMRSLFRDDGALSLYQQLTQKNRIY